MSVDLPNNFILEFNAATELLLQVVPARLRGTVMSGTHTGEGASPVNQYGTLEMREANTRFGPLNVTHIDVTRRWVYPTDYELAQQLDKRDLLRLIEDPKGPMAQAAALAVARREDLSIITAATATANIGKQGGSTETFDTATYQIASGSVGLTLDKMRDAMKRFMEANVDVRSERPTLLIGPEQWEDLLSSAEVTSGDFNRGYANETGIIPNLLGFQIIQTNQLPEVSAGVRGCLAYVKSGIHFGSWKDVENRVDERTDLEGIPYQMYTCMTHGVTRTQQGKVIQILCSE